MEKVNIYTKPRLWDVVSAGFGGEEYYLKVARETGGPVLELGSGTGRVISCLTTAGFDCVGLDLCPEMTRYASEKVPAAQFLTGDMRGFDLERLFNLIFAANNTIQYLDRVDDLLAALGRIRRHLAPEGRAVLSMINPRPERIASRTEPEEAMRFIDPDTGREILIMQTFHFEPDTQIGTTVWVHHDRGQPVLAYEFPLVFRTAEEMSAHIEAAGLRIERLTGRHDGAPFSEDSSPHMIFSLSGG